MFEWLKDILGEQADKIIPVLETQKVGLEQAYLFQLLNPLLNLSGVMIEDDNGMLKEYIDKEIIADKIIDIINKHAKIRVRDLKKAVEELEKE